MKIKISDIFAPAYLLLTLGMDYMPNPYFSAFIALLAAKITFVNDPVLSAAGAFGATPGEKSRTEIGGYVRAIYTKNDFKMNFSEMSLSFQKLTCFQITAITLRILM